MAEELANLNARLGRAMAYDRARLGRRLSSIADALSRGKPQGRNLTRIARELDASIKRREQRAAGVPKINYDDALPIISVIEKIQQTIRDHPVVVVAGETGSGKSTQLPKLLLEMGRGIDGLIGHTQPRRLAARSVASRVAEELGSPLGEAVGYKIRFTDKTNPKTYIKLMTDGVLLAEAARDRRFEAYDTLIIDEAHERSLNIDFLLGHLKQVLAGRPDLRIIITSATIDTQRFAEHFTDEKTGRPAPVIEVSGRTYPVELLYRPPELDEDNPDDDQALAVLGAVEELTAHGRGSGDILVFMPTERDIRETVGLLEDRLGRRNPPTDVLPLYARLTNAEQQAIFAPRKRRKIVVATNVAESSLTVPGIRYVIDTGTARVSRYSPNSKVQRLPIEPVSRASCDQRKGRCGRVGPGVCIRLYSEEDFTSRDAFNTPEIQRSNLASVILQVTALKFGAIERFPFIDPPRPSMVRDGYKTLHELGAIDDHYDLTEMGRALAKMPVDPRVARMVLAGVEEGVLEEVLIVASALEVQDPRDRPIDQQGKADAAHEQWADPRSDFLAFINLWRFYHRQQQKLSNNQLRKACRQNYLNYMRMREWVDVHRQLRRLAEDLPGREIRQSTEQDKPINDPRSDAIHRALLTGLLSNIATKGEGFAYTGAGGQKLHLWPGSALFENKPKWVVAAELVETTRRYARTIGRVQPGMIEPLAGHLVKLNHSDPRWNPDTGSALCSEKVSLFGLTLVPARPVALGKVNAVEARQLFIQMGLIAGQVSL
ncbi:MAG: ATP-dependent RNA helicase HrpA, partial [Planctomycetota bacterium]